MRIINDDLDDDAGIVVTDIIFLSVVVVAIAILRTVLLVRARVYFIYNEILSALRIDTILVSSMVSGEARCVRKNVSLSHSRSLSMIYLICFPILDKFSVLLVCWFWAFFFEQVVYAVVMLFVTSVSDVLPVVQRRFRLFD